MSSSEILRNANVPLLDFCLINFVLYFKCNSCNNVTVEISYGLFEQNLPITSFAV